MYGDVVMVILYLISMTYRLYGAYYDFSMILDGQYTPQLIHLNTTECKLYSYRLGDGITYYGLSTQ
jgi:hypothetical protein